jgi:hypothetical protein
VRFLSIFLTLCTSFVSAANASSWPECDVKVGTRPFVILSEFTSNKVLGQDTRQTTRQVLNELLGKSLMSKARNGTYQSAFFASWNVNEAATVFDFLVMGDYRDEKSLMYLENSLRSSLFNTGIVEGTLAIQTKSNSIRIELEKPRPRLLDYLTQIHPTRSNPSEYLAHGDYQILCQMFEGSHLRVKRRKPEAGRPEIIDISTDPQAYRTSGFVISPSFSDEVGGFHDNHMSRHRASLWVLALNPDLKAVQSDDFRKLLSCTLNQQELVKTFQAGSLNFPFYSIVPKTCNSKTGSQYPAAFKKNQTYTLTYAGDEQPFFKEIESQLRKSGIRVAIKPAEGDTQHLGRIFSMPVMDLEPALSLKGLCEGWAQWIPACKQNAVRDKALAYRGRDIGSVIAPLFENQLIIPLLYRPYTYLARKSAVDSFEESPTEILNLSNMKFHSTYFEKN